MIEHVERLAACVAARWRPTIGDASAMGWATVAAYVAAAALAGWMWRRGRAGGAGGTVRESGSAARRETLFWAGLALGLAALAVNKQFDLQSALTAIGRCEAKIGGWYAARRGVQAAFVLGLGALAVATVAGLGLWLRASLRRLWPTLLGVALLGGFVMIRAVGFHHVDQLIGLRVAGWRMNWALELGSIAAICLGVGFAARKPVGGTPEAGRGATAR